MDTILKRIIEDHKAAEDCLAAQTGLIIKIAGLCVSSLKSGGKLIFCGNGGSAADSQHLAAELVGRFTRDKNPLPALALSVNTSVITAIGNDYGFDRVFEDQIKALADKKDILFAISTSGNSSNVINAVNQAKKQGMITVGLLGGQGGALKDMVDHALIIAGKSTARVQEMHIFAGHMLCALIEDAFYE